MEILMSDNIPLQNLDAAPASSDSAEQLELDSIHDFATKLTQPGAKQALEHYVRWQVAQRSAENTDAGGLNPEKVPDFAPVSINLDLTTACNFACDHCVDLDILNTGIRFDHDKLLSSLELMAGRGLRSVIVIGGGEPTLYPKFEEVIRFMKRLGLQISIVSNGTGNAKIARVADCMDASDWVRLSLDSGSDATFQPMHKPRKGISLLDICARVADIKDANPDVVVGFSYIVTWRGAFINDTSIVENLHEITMAAQLAKDCRFDYISFKPFLTRDELNNAEVIDLGQQNNLVDTVSRIQAEIDAAMQLETDTFRVHRSTGLKAMLQGRTQTLARQPQQCHMQFFRQVLSPLGLYNCPVYRNQDHGRLGDRNAVADEPAYQATRGVTADLVRHFDAATACEKVTCLYNDVNWWIESLVANPQVLEQLPTNDTAEPDYFL
jgi:organic radical activating enzyme